MMVRGAAVLCANNQAGIDAIVPFCYCGKEFSKKNTSAILVQSKNVTMLDTLLPAIFTAMDPTLLSIFNPEKNVDQMPPVIKIVFSLGSDLASFTIPLVQTRFSVQTSCTHTQSVDIFASGVSHETFGPS
jgi:hypothetical protein